MSGTNGQLTYYGSLDGLRAYSAIGIILMHVLTNGNYGLSGFVFEQLIPSFTNLVFLFMAVSGFSLCCGYFDKIINNQISVAEFYSKRYAKIWPFFALLCILDFVISPSKNALYEVFANLTLCFGLLPNTDISVIGVGWFLGLVFAFYLVFPFFFRNGQIETVFRPQCISRHIDVRPPLDVQRMNLLSEGFNRSTILGSCKLHH